MIIINPPTLLNALNKALDISEGSTGDFPAQVRLLYQNPARTPQPITFVGDSEIYCPDMLIGKGQRVTFSGDVPPELATGTFYAIPSSLYGTDPSSHFFRVAATAAEAEISDFVEFTTTIESGSFVFDVDIDPQDTLETLLIYEQPATPPVTLSRQSVAYDAVAKKATANYGDAVFTGTSEAIPISHRLTFFGGTPGSYYTPFFDVTPTPQTSIDVGGSASFAISIEIIADSPPP